MKNMSYADLRKHADWLDQQKTLLDKFLHDIVNNVRPDCSANEEDYHAVLYRGNGADGGYFVLTRTYRGTTVASIHALESVSARWPLPIRLIAERLTVQRNRIFYSDNLQTKAQLTTP